MPPRRSGRTSKQTEKAKGKSNGVKKPQQRRGKKRTATEDVDDGQAQKKVANNRIVDKYCWQCHQLGYDIICNSCPKVFHAECVRKPRSKIISSGACLECRAVSVSGSTDVLTIEPHLMRDILMAVTQICIRENGKKPETMSAQSKFIKHLHVLPLETSQESLCYCIDIQRLIDKINDNKYKTTAKLFADVKWMYHNCYIIYGREDENEQTETALKLIRKFKYELSDLEACPECYYVKHCGDLSDDFFAEVCQEPHDIVWAKLRDSPYWPAKVLRIHNNHAHIRFFGTHDKSNISLNQCFRISQESPNRKTIKRPDYKEAVTELAVYIENYEKRFGKFIYYPDRTPLEADNSKMERRRVFQRMGAYDVDNDNGREEVRVSNSYSDAAIVKNNQGNNLPTAVINPHYDSMNICMTFTADEENQQAEINNKFALLEDSYIHPVTTSSSSSDYVSNESPFRDLQQGVNSVSDNSNFVNSEGNAGPCIESVTNYENILTSSQGTINNDNAPANNSDQLVANYSSVSPDIAAGLGSDSSNREIPSIEIIGHASSTAPRSKNLKFKELARQITNRHDIEDDSQAVAVILERLSESRIVTNFTKYRALTDALIQRLLFRHPQWKKIYTEMNAFTKGIFLQMWLLIEDVRVHEEPLAVFSSIYYEEQGKRLQYEEENKQLKEEISVLKKTIEDLQKTMDEIESEQEGNRKKIIEAISKNLSFGSKKYAEYLNQYVNAGRNLEQEDPQLHLNCNKQLESKTNEILLLKQYVEHIQSKLQALETAKNERNQSAPSAESSQNTPIPDSQDKENCVLKEGKIKAETLNGSPVLRKSKNVEKTAESIEDLESMDDEITITASANQIVQGGLFESLHSTDIETRSSASESFEREDNALSDVETRSFASDSLDDALCYEEETIVRTQELIMQPVASTSAISPNDVCSANFSLVVSTSVSRTSTVMTQSSTSSAETDITENE